MMKALLLTLLLAINLSPEEYQEEKFKALFITKFIEYIEWPGSGSNTIGVYGSNLVLSELEKSVAAKGFKVIPVKSVADVNDIKVLYVPNVNEAKAKELLNAVASKAVLVISDQKESVGKTADIGFFVNEGKLRFAISKSRIEKKKMLPSSKLLALGEVI